jgi:putative transcriptional regulator
MRKTLALALVLQIGLSASAFAEDVSAPMILVAKPGLRDDLYGSSILVVTPLGGDEHIGFIVNRPTTVSLGSMLPRHGPAQKVVDPVYLGGPAGSQMIFAMVQRPESPGGHSVALMPGLYLAFDVAVLDSIIEKDSHHARFMAGLVAWQAGELRAEIEAGAWYVLKPDAALVMREPEGLWEELVRRSQLAEKAI